MKNYLSFLLAFYLLTSLSAQTNAERNDSIFPFTKHLIANGLYGEASYFLKGIHQSSTNRWLTDTTAYLLGTIEMRKGSLSSNYFNKVSTSAPGLSEKAYLAIRYNNLKAGAPTLSEPPNVVKHEGYLAALSLADSILHQEGYQKKFPAEGAMAEDLRMYYREYCRLPQRSPLLAAVFSAVVPGTGKIYAGEAQQFLPTFLPCMLLAGQSLEGFIRGGRNDLRFIVFGSLFAVFHIGNIYSSAKIPLRKRKMAYENLHRNIVSRIGPGLRDLLFTEGE